MLFPKKVHCMDRVMDDDEIYTLQHVTLGVNNGRLNVIKAQ
jgi:hypothetical protein